MNTIYLKDHLFKSIESLEEKILLYQSRVQKHRHQYHHARKTSKKEIQDDIKQLIDLAGNSPDIDIPLEIIILGKDILGSSVWVLHCYLNYLKSFLHFSIKNQPLDNQNHQQIIQDVSSGIPLDKIHWRPRQIFQAVFNDLTRADEDPLYISSLACPKIKTTIVLVSGLLNEFYRTATFERGARYLQKQFGVKYYAPKIHGRRGSTHNARLLRKQLTSYIEQHPSEKLWILAHSKGGVDSLHFMKRNPEFSRQYLVGISTIAAPITGTQHAQSFLAKTLQTLIRLENTTLYQKLDRGRDFLLKNVPYYLSENFQRRWFDKNAKYLPENIFYSSLALESEWYQAHFWMLFAKFLLKNDKPNDGVVDIEQAHFPDCFEHINLGTVNGHHLIGTRSSTFNQEALIQAHIITLHFLGVLD